MYEMYEVHIKFREKIAGGIPKNPKVIEDWIQAKMKGKLTKEEQKELTKKTIEEMDVEEEVKKSWAGFKCDDKGIYIEDRNVRGMFKEAASVLEINRGKGSVQIKQVLQHGFFIKPAHIHLFRENSKELIQEPDGYEERAIQIIGPKGPRTALKRYDYVERAEIQFQVLIAKPFSGEKSQITEDMMTHMIKLGQEVGTGADRSQQMGKFDIVEFTKKEDISDKNLP